MVQKRVGQSIAGATTENWTAFNALTFEDALGGW